MMKQMQDILFFEKPVNLLVFVHENPETYFSGVAKGIDCHMTHVHKLAAKLEAAGLIITWIDGRTRQIRLTDKGRNVAAKVYELLVDLKWYGVLRK